MESKKSNKIREIVRLQQVLKKWKKLAKTTSIATNPTSTSTTTTPSSNAIRGINFLKRTFSFSDVVVHHQNDVVSKGFLAVCVGKELKRFIIPTDYLGHQAFRILLQEAEEEFGFQQAGVLKIPCVLFVFETILKVVEDKREDVFFSHEFEFNEENSDMNGSCSSPSDFELTASHPQM